MHRLLILFTASLFSFYLYSQPALTFTEIADGLDMPTAISAPNDGSNRLFVTEKGGVIKVVDLADEDASPTTFIDLSSSISSYFERGLLGLAFHPDYANNGYFYVHYSASGTRGVTEGSNVISRFTMSDPAAMVADEDTEQVLFTSPQDYANHNGGDLLFGPDGLLYFTIGDGGSSGDPNGNAQNTMNMMGTIGRIDVDNTTGDLMYAIPADNPFVDGVGGLAEIFSYGWRNPWRMSFDRLTGDAWVADVGQNQQEEIDFIPAGTGAGLNYGWDCKEGDDFFYSPSSVCTSDGDYVEPIVTLFHNSGPMASYSITGGYVYRGSKWPELYGIYICADFASNNYFLISPDDTEGWTVSAQAVSQTPSVATFGESEAGELYVASLSDGKVFQVGGGISGVPNFYKEATFDVSVSPNPVINRLQVSIEGLDTREALSVQLVDIEGQLILEQTWPNTGSVLTKTMNLPALKSGVYQLVVSDSSGGKVNPVIVLQ